MNLLRRLWGNLAMIGVAVYLVTLVLPATRSESFNHYEVRWGWYAAALVGAGLCVIAAVVPTRAFRPPKVWPPRGWQWRVAAAMWASSYIALRGMYVEWRFGNLAPGSSLAEAWALALCIAWSWGRPPIVAQQLEYHLIEEEAE